MNLIKYFFLSFFAFFTLLFLVSCAEDPKKAPAQRRPIQEENLSQEIIKNFSAVVRLSPGPTCSGVVVSNCVLTAKHCVEGGINRTSIKSVTRKKYALDKTLSPRFLENKNSKNFTHTFTIRRLMNDLAILKLKDSYPDALDKSMLVSQPIKNFKWNELFKEVESIIKKPLELDKDDVLVANTVIEHKLATEAIIRGYGGKSPIAHEETLRIVGDYGEYYLKGTSGLVLSFSKDKKSALNPGDSGGALFIKDKDSEKLKLYGINVAANQLGDKNLSVSISHNREWIDETLTSLHCN